MISKIINLAYFLFVISVLSHKFYHTLNSKIMIKMRVLGNWLAVGQVLLANYSPLSTHVQCYVFFGLVTLLNQLLE